MVGLLDAAVARAADDLAGAVAHHEGQVRAGVLAAQRGVDVVLHALGGGTGVYHSRHSSPSGQRRAQGRRRARAPAAPGARAFRKA
jgi:hypothetical protein